MGDGRAGGEKGIAERIGKGGKILYAGWVDGAIGGRGNWGEGNGRNRRNERGRGRGGGGGEGWRRTVDRGGMRSVG